ncbi:MAG TPA: hypothetical protein VKM93_10630 [Terriglobia bacterium]|nr:hypothetical protein [Terriglobia bacterium]
MDDQKKQYGFSVVDVGQGSFQVFELGNGDCIIFDCNLKGAPEYVLRYLGRRKIKRIALLVITGTDEDHADVDGLRMLAARYDIERVWVPDFPKATDNWKAFKEVLAELEKDGTVVEKPTAGDEMDVGTVHLKALGPHPEDSSTSNNASLVVKLTADEVGFLIPGDCENERWESILKFFKKWLPSDVLVVPHHGSDHGCVEEVIEIVKPLYAVVSVGEDNKYGHPDKGAMAVYRKHSKRVFTTKDDGSVLFECDGERITNVITDAGKDPEGVREQATKVAAAAAGSASIYIGPSGSPSTTPGNGVLYRPTHFHGGDKANDAAEEGVALFSSEEMEAQLRGVENAFELVQRITANAAFGLHPLLRSALKESHIRAAFVVTLSTTWGRAYRVLFVVPSWYPRTPPAAYCLDTIKGEYYVQHIYRSDWRICFHYSVARDWNPKECTLITAVGWAAMWLFCQEYLQKYKKWPAPVGMDEPIVRRSRHSWPPRRR